MAADFYATEAASYVCTEDPDHCDLTTFAVPGHADVHELRAVHEEAGPSRLAGGPAGPGGYVVVESIVVAPDGRTAVLRACSGTTG